MSAHEAGVVETVDIGVARRVALVAQRLDSVPKSKDLAAIKSAARALNCLQLDPTSAVARNQYLVLWSRLGNHDPALLDRAVYQERTMFEYWAHAASLVMTEDFPLHESLMRAYRRGNKPWHLELRSWVDSNKRVKNYVLRELRSHGPLPSRQLSDDSDEGRKSGGWSNDRNVQRMLGCLWTQGHVLVAGRQGATRLWDLAERVLPDWTPRDRLSDTEVVRRTTEFALRSIGIATERQIGSHFVRRRSPRLAVPLRHLERAGIAHRITVSRSGIPFPEQWWIHRDYLPLLEGDPPSSSPRTTLLSPFDNLICDRDRTELLFDFHFRLEIYTPKKKRRHGYFVMPVLHGDRIVGRLDLAADRKERVLRAIAVHAEERAPARAGAGIRRALEDLAVFCGTDSISVTGDAPAIWRRSLPR